MKLHRVNMRAVRESMGVSQEMVGAVAGVSQRTVSNVEAGMSSANSTEAVYNALRTLGRQYPLGLSVGQPTEEVHRIAGRLTRAIESLDASYSEIADLMGVGNTTVRQYANGDRRAPMSFIQAFQASFGINLLK